jgi:putative ABC transport system substrate-binding protein
VNRRTAGALGRRRFLGLLAGILAVPREADSQPPAKKWRIGVLTVGSTAATPLFQAFRQGLQDVGYIEGQNLLLEFRLAHDRVDRLQVLAAELVQMNVDVIVTDSNATAAAAKRATQTLPIVMAASGDPIGSRLVATLARPGGNVIGSTLVSPELSAKRLQLLKETVPTAVVVAVIWNANNPAAAGYFAETEAAARAINFQLQSIKVASPDDLAAAFKSVRTAHRTALITLPDAMLFANRVRIAELTAKSHLPALFPERQFAEAGGLMAYGPDVTVSFRRAATFVDRILKGAKPSELPVEQPTKFELVINLKTAATLGVTIPPSLLLRADQIIQ